MLKPGDNVGPYTLVRELGSGSFGVAWLADKITRITTQFALKIPKLYASDDQLFVDWQKEAERWAKLKRHPNIVPIIEADQFSVTPAQTDRDAPAPPHVFAIVSEYIDGGTLAEFLTKNSDVAANVGDAIEIVCQVLEGVAHLHREGFIHRDIKPANVFLQSGKPRIGDFGMSRQFDDTQSAGWGGSPGYMSPEAFRNERSAQLDLWSIGVLLYEMVHGYRPFASIREITSTTPASIDPSVPENIRHVLRKALDKNPDNRFLSADDFLSAMRSSVLHDVSPHVTDDYATQLNATSTFGGREDRLCRFIETVSNFRMPTVSDSKYAAKVVADPHGLREIADELCREIAGIYDRLLPIYDAQKYLILDDWARHSLQAVVERVARRVKNRLAVATQPNTLVLGEDHKTAALRVAFQRCLHQAIMYEIRGRGSTASDESAREFVNFIDELGTAAKDNDQDWKVAETTA